MREFSLSHPAVVPPAFPEGLALASDLDSLRQVFPSERGLSLSEVVSAFVCD